MSNEYAAVTGTYKGLRTMRDGTVRVEIDVDRSEAKALFAFVAPDVAVAIARLSDGAARDAASATIGDYGQNAYALDRSGFWRIPMVWQAAGPDGMFLEWVRKQPCAICGNSIEVEAAHVRRISRGAGISRKPPYSALPLCSTHHREQHAHGEESLKEKSWWEATSVRAVSTWARERVKLDLGYASWRDVPPLTLIAWAEEHGVSDYLPAFTRAYRMVTDGD